MDKIKKAYVDSRFRTHDSNSDSDFKFELKEALDLPDNTVCYIDDISIPHTWRTIESHNNKFYIIFKMFYLAGGGYQITEAYNYMPYVLELPPGNYTGPQMAAAIQELLNSFNLTFNFEVLYHTARGSITIEATNPEGMDEHDKFFIPSDFGIITWLSNTNGDYPWTDINGYPERIDPGNLHSINGVLRNSDMIPASLQSEWYRSYESGFIDLLTVHNVYLHCPNLGHFNSIGVRGENTIIKKVPVSSGFGYLIIDSVVSPHDKIDVSRQLIKTVEFSLRDVYGSIINLHGAAISFSLVFVTID